MRNRFKLSLSTGVAVTTLFLAAAPALAQEVGAAAPQSGIGDIVVTAQKRAQNIQDVPISISAFDENAKTAIATIKAETLL